MRMRLFLPLGIVIFLIAVWAFAGTSSNKPFEEAGEIIRFRQIGHELLLSAGDSTSRVLPVRRVSSHEYRLEFENDFALMPDSLVRIVSRILKKDVLPVNYIINVIETASREVVYGFAFSERDKGSIPCVGRALPKKSYMISILWPATESTSLFEKQAFYNLVGGLLLGACLVLLAVYFFQPGTKQIVEKREEEPEQEKLNAGSIAIGKYLFYPDRQLLIIEQGKTRLTNKESKLLGVFAGKQNLPVDRHCLLKVWEDDGVITGRSLDMYVSRLRKLLQKDNSVSIKNIHGKGYILSIT